VASPTPGSVAAIRSRFAATAAFAVLGAAVWLPGTALAKPPGASSSAAAAASPAQALPDFNGDGFSDLAVGIPDEDFSGTDDGGASVVYGDGTGLSATAVPDQFLGQDTPDVEGTAESGDRFGDAIATGDFNGDGFSDLAVGAPGEDYHGTDDGVVNVVYGSRNRLSPTAVPDQLLSQDTPDVEGTAEDHDEFGASLAAGDFNGDGYADLAVGVPYEDGGASNQGYANVIYGGPGGLSPTGVPDQLLSQDSPDVEGIGEDDDRFASSLTAADFNGDGRSDLAIGVPNEDYSATNDGGVNVMFGGPGGLSATGTPDQFLSQDTPGVDDTAESADHFGTALAAGDFNADGRADLAVGVPDEDTGTFDEGAVNVLYGWSSGLSPTAVPDQFIDQDTPGVYGTAEYEDAFGSSLAAGDFNADGRADLAIGVPFEDYSAIDDGGVDVVNGTSAGLSPSAVPDQFLSQDSPGVYGTAEDGDRYGTSLTVGDFNGNGSADLAIGVPYEDFNSVDDGGVSVIPGGTGGLSATAAPDQFIGQDSPDVEGTAEGGDRYGNRLPGR
jgi:hypothetical protein